MKTRNTIIIVLILSFSGKILGFIRDIFITNYLGFGFKTDALLLSISIITITFSVFNTTIRTTFSPMFSAKYLDNRNLALKEYNNIRNILILFSIFLAIVFNVFSKQIIMIFAPGLGIDTVQLAAKSLQILSILLVFYNIYYLTTGFLQSIKIFTTVETANIFNNLIIVVLIFILFPYIGFYSILVGYILGSIIQMIYSHNVFKRKVAYKFNFKFKLRSESWVTFIKYSKIILFGTLVAQLTVFADKFVASFLTEGSISALHYASLLKNLPLTIVILAVTNVLFTNLSISFKSSTKLEFKNQVFMQSKYLLYLIMPFILILFIYSEEIIKVLFYRGEFTLNGVYMTSIALKAYSIGMFFWVLKEIYTKVSYAARDTKTPLIIAVLSFFINFVLNFLLGFKYGHVGIAISTSIAILINSFLIVLILHKKNIVKFNTKDLVYYIKVSLVFIFSLFILSKVKKYITLILDTDIFILMSGSLTIIILWILISKLVGVDLLNMLLGGRKRNE